jgi:hypothetical protein
MLEKFLTQHVLVLFSSAINAREIPYPTRAGAVLECHQRSSFISSSFGFFKFIVTVEARGKWQSLEPARLPALT